MLATLVPEPFDRPGWAYEEKYDGERILAYGGPSRVVRTHDPKIGPLCGIWIAFVLGAGTGATMVLHFGSVGVLGAALLLIPLLLYEVQS
jgi:hypothetical protein